MSRSTISRRKALSLITTFSLYPFNRAFSFDTASTQAQPYFASVGRALQQLARLGAPVASVHADQVSILSTRSDAEAVNAADAILDKYTLARLRLHEDGTLGIEQGGAPRELLEHGWKLFLVRIDNLTGNGITIAFPASVESLTEMAQRAGSTAQRPALLDTVEMAPIIESMWFASALIGSNPTRINGFELSVLELSGILREYHVLQIYCRDRGRKEATLTFRTPRAGPWPWFGGVSRRFDFIAKPSRDVHLSVLDHDGIGCMAALTIKDRQGHVYPLQAMRIAPDMFFHEHIYRADGEMLKLPDGEYFVTAARGPEYLRTAHHLKVDDAHDSLAVRLSRWIDPARWGWYSGDTHIHASGCAHYQVPTEGVTPETMVRHVRGEALSIGEVLTWGPSWYYQKQFFSGSAQSPPAELEHAQLQAANNAAWPTRSTPKDSESLLRYDVEVSGFPSSLSGHLVLLRLQEQDYPGTRHIEDWPSWNLPILKWAKRQGAVTGYAHCALGMAVETEALPNYIIPPFDSIGLNEAIVDVTHGQVDFLAGCNLFPLAELNGWYHMLNCGFRVALAGETDYPCVSGERPGVGRTYVKLPDRPQDDAGYEAWVLGLRDGRVYCGDGRSHFLDFRLENRLPGADLAIERERLVRVRATVTARLEPQPLSAAQMSDVNIKGRWHLENARILGTRNVAVELIVNGAPAGQVEIVADGQPRNVHFNIRLARSSWVALRILPSSHTSPIYVYVRGRPIRSSRRSAKWCRDCVDKLWQVKSPFIRSTERAAAEAAYEHARQMYETIADECAVDS